MDLIAQSIGNNVTSLTKYENSFQPFSKGQIRFYVNTPPDQSLIDILQLSITDQGVTLTDPIIQDLGIIVINFQKISDSLMIIGESTIATLGTISGWQLFKEESSKFPLWGWAVTAALALSTWVVIRSRKLKKV